MCKGKYIIPENAILKNAKIRISNMSSFKRIKPRQQTTVDTNQSSSVSQTAKFHIDIKICMKD